MQQRTNINIENTYFLKFKKSTQNAKECVFNMSYKSRHLKEWKREAIQRKHSWEFPKIDERHEFSDLRSTSLK